MSTVRRIVWAPVAGELHAANVDAARASVDPASWLFATEAAARSFLLACAIAPARLLTIAGVGGASASPLDVLGAPQLTAADRDWTGPRGHAAAYWYAMIGALRPLVLRGLVKNAQGAPRLDDAILGAPAGFDPLSVVATIETPCAGDVARASVLTGDRAVVALRWSRALELARVQAAAVAAVPGFMGGAPSVPADVLAMARAESSLIGPAIAGGILSAAALWLPRLA